MSKDSRRKKFLVVAVGIVVILGVAAWLAIPMLSPTPKDTVSVALDWVVLGRHSPWFVALDKGYYAKNNIEINGFIPGQGGPDATKKVASGVAQFGFIDVPSLILARDHGAKLQMVAVIYSAFPDVAYAQSYIKTPKELEGATYAVSAGDISLVLFPAFAKAAGFDYHKVKTVIVDASAKVPLFLAGKVDSTSTYAFSTPLILKRKPNTTIMKWADYGLQMYANGIVTTDELVRSKPDLVKRFVAATLEGYRWAIEHPTEAVNVLLKHNPALNREDALSEQPIIKELIWTKSAQEKALGWMDPEVMKDSLQTMIKYYEMKSTMSPSDIYTNNFLPKS